MQLNSFYFFFFSAVVLAFVTITFHILSYFPWLNTSGDILTFLLGGGAIFSVFLGIKSNQGILTPKDANINWEIVWKGIPGGLKILLILLIPYVFFNFFFSLLFLTKGLYPEKLNDVYVLMSKGRMVREITEAEFFQNKAYIFRGVSGHFLVFQIFSIALMRSSMNRPVGPGNERNH